MFAERLKELRIEKGMKQNALAEILSISSKTISGYENGVSQPNIDILIKLAKYFDVTVDYLIGASEYRNTDSENCGKSLGLSDTTLQILKEDYEGQDKLMSRILNILIPQEYFYNFFMYFDCYVQGFTVEEVDSFNEYMQERNGKPHIDYDTFVKMRLEALTNDFRGFTEIVRASIKKQSE